MGKSVYSLVLSDEVVEEIDRLSYALGISRSGFIDRILAERVGFSTAEMRADGIYESLERLISEFGGGFIVKAENRSMLIRSSFRYKYKPTIRYSLQLLRTEGDTEGELKVSFRTQSEELKEKMKKFLKLWSELENTYIVRFFPNGIRYIIEDGRFLRTFVLPKEYKDKAHEDIAKAIAEYIYMFDDVLKCFFSADKTETGALEAAKKYIEYLKRGIVII